LFEFQLSSKMGRLLCLHAKALNMSNITKVVKVIVLSLDDTLPSSISTRNTYMVPEKEREEDKGGKETEEEEREREKRKRIEGGGGGGRVERSE
jgi:hypothetical protein